MQNVTFITGNQNKADFLVKWLGIPLLHQKLELDELQSLDLRTIVEHKAGQAYETVQKPVLVEDVSLTMHALGKLPGPFIKWFLQELSHEQLCNLLSEYADRSATAAVAYCIFDGADLHFFEGSVRGTIPASPRGENGFGFDPIFVPDGAAHTYAEMTDKELALFGLRPTTVFPKLRAYFNKT
jgi:non-canonical purine NTP pyrophosphatase (RdgB/HAM1 family)